MGFLKKNLEKVSAQPQMSHHDLGLGRGLHRRAGIGCRLVNAGVWWRLRLGSDWLIPWCLQHAQGAKLALERSARQRLILIEKSQTVGAAAKCMDTQRRGLVPRERLNPLAQRLYCVFAQRHQGVACGLLLGQTGVEQLLESPGGLTQIMQIHHARAALERMKRAAQRCLRRMVTRLRGQCVQRLHSVLKHFARLGQEYGADLAVAVVICSVERQCKTNRID